MSDTIPSAEVNIEEIMQQIRQQILAKRLATAPDGRSPIRIAGKHLPADFYEHLYQAGLVYDQIQVPVNVSRIAVPVIGPLLQTIRHKLHELVIFYVNQLAANQIQMNHHLLQALNILAEELEKREEESGK